MSVSAVQTSDAKLLDVDSVATMLGCSPRTVYRLADAGRMPRPIKLGSLVRWNRSVLESWVTDGCPRIDARVK